MSGRKLRGGDDARRRTTPPDLLQLLGSNGADHVTGLNLEAAALRRALTGAEAIRDLFGPTRALVAYWVALEVAAAQARKETISQKQLAALAHRIWSQATISRAVRDLTKAGFITAKPNPNDRRSPTLEAPDQVQAAFRMRRAATRLLLAEQERK